MSILFMPFLSSSCTSAGSVIFLLFSDFIFLRFGVWARWGREKVREKFGEGERRGESQVRKRARKRLRMKKVESKTGV